MYAAVLGTDAIFAGAIGGSRAAHDQPRHRSATVPRSTAETSAPQRGHVHEMCCRTKTSETDGGTEKSDGDGGSAYEERATDGRTWRE